MTYQSFKCGLLTFIFLTGLKKYSVNSESISIHICKGLEPDKFLMKFTLTDKGCFHLLWIFKKACLNIMYLISGLFFYKSYEDGNQESVKPVLLRIWNLTLALHHTRKVVGEGISLKE